jgi:hypothetical protein
MNLGMTCTMQYRKPNERKHSGTTSLGPHPHDHTPPRLRLPDPKLVLPPPTHLLLRHAHPRAQHRQRPARRRRRRPLRLPRPHGHQRPQERRPAGATRRRRGPRQGLDDGGRGALVRGGELALQEGVQVGAHGGLAPEGGRVERAAQGQLGDGVGVVGAVGGGEGEVRQGGRGLCLPPPRVPSAFASWLCSCLWDVFLVVSFFNFSAVFRKEGGRNKRTFVAGCQGQERYRAV